MRNRFLTSLNTLLAVIAVIWLVPVSVAGQASLAKAAPAATVKKTWTPPRTADGQPDLQGLWTNATITPFERSKEFAGKEFLTEKEAAEFENRALQNANRDRRGANAEADVAGAYNDFWFERGTKVVPTRRTSLVVDPADGKIPALTPQAQKVAAAR